MVNWSKLFRIKTPTVGTPGMHMTPPNPTVETPETPPPSVQEPTTKPTAPVAQQTPPTPPQAPVQKPETPVASTAPVPTPTPPQTPNYFFTPRTDPLTEAEQTAGKAAHLIRLANVTSCFEAPNGPGMDMPAKRHPTPAEQARGDDVPLLMPASRFYVCKADKTKGLTIGYGTFFKKGRNLIAEDEAILPSLQLLNEATRQEIKTTSQKSAVVKQLFRHHSNPKRLSQQPYSISVESADAMLRARFNHMSNDLDRLMSNKGKRKVKPRSVLTDWLATDLYYQGMLSSKTGIPNFAENNINKKKLPGPNPKVLRITARRTCGDLQDIIRANPFTPDMTEEERQTHARRLSEYCTAYTAHQMTREAPDYCYQRNHVQAHIQDLSSLATMDIARAYYGRELSAEEIRQCRQNSADISKRIFKSQNPPVYAMRLSLATEEKVKNPLGHFRAEAKTLASARAQLKAEKEAEKQTPKKETPAKNPNLAGHLKENASPVSPKETALPTQKNQDHTIT